MEIEMKKFLLSIVLPIATSVAFGSSYTVADFDFNDGLQGWSVQEGTWADWELKDGALYVAGNPSIDFRTHSSVTSPVVSLPAEASLRFEAAYSSSFDVYCRLQLLISTDGFKSSRILWNSKNFTSSPWGWNSYEISLSEFADSDVQFRFYYTTGYLDNYLDKGGYLGEFAVDDFLITAEETAIANPDDPEEPDDPKDPGNGDKPSDPNQPGEDNPSDPGESENPGHNGVGTIDADTVITVYNLNGVLIYRGTQKEIPALPAGYYIVNKERILIN